MDIQYLLWLQDFRNSINNAWTPFMEFRKQKRPLLLREQQPENKTIRKSYGRPDLNFLYRSRRN